MFLITLLIGLIGVLVFLSTFESAVTQLGEVQLRVLRAENERSFHARFCASWWRIVIGCCSPSAWACS